MRRAAGWKICWAAAKAATAAVLATFWANWQAVVKPPKPRSKVVVLVIFWANWQALAAQAVGQPSQPAVWGTFWVS